MGSEIKSSVLIRPVWSVSRWRMRCLTLTRWSYSLVVSHRSTMTSWILWRNLNLKGNKLHFASSYQVRKSGHVWGHGSTGQELNSVLSVQSNTPGQWCRSSCVLYFLKMQCIPSFILNLCLEWEFTSSALTADSSGCLVVCPLIMVRLGTGSRGYKTLSGLIK